MSPGPVPRAFLAWFPAPAGFLEPSWPGSSHPKNMSNKIFGVAEVSKVSKVTTSFQKFQLERQLETATNAEVTLKKEIIDLEQQERALVKELNEKYGAGTLDPQTGEFKPAQS